MNYWNYFNASPGVEPAGMLILDDVHLLEGPLRDLFTVCIRRSNDLYYEILRRIVERCDYYRLARDLLGGVESIDPPEMLAFADSAALADEIRGLLDSQLAEGGEAWWAWRRVRGRLEVCCWLVSARAVTLTPYIPPTQTLTHFEEPSRRLYLSATLGSVDDLQRRLGAPPFDKLTASAQPRQGERLVIMHDGTERLAASELVAELRGFLACHGKALWLCARRNTAEAFQDALTQATLGCQVHRLEADNGTDEIFSAADAGHLVAAGRYDGMDFPGDACQVEVVPEVPVATSDLEEFVSAYLRDAPFAEARFAQRVTQALGRCNRGEDDRAVYVLSDPEFLGRFSQRRFLDGLPDDVRADVHAALERSDRGIDAGLTEADRFLAGESIQQSQPPPRLAPPTTPPTAADEVDGMLALWREDYLGAASLFDRVANALTEAREHRAFWLAMRALALQRLAEHGDQAASTEAAAALQAAASTGAVSTFFTRLRLAEARLQGEAAASPSDRHDAVFAAWDRLIDRHGAHGPRFEKWGTQLETSLRSENHDEVARAIAAVGTDLLGLPTQAPAAAAGEADAYWELSDPRRTLTFEVKLAPRTQRVVNNDVEQAEGAARAAETSRGHSARGILLTPHEAVDETAEARLERVCLMNREVFIDQARRLIAVTREYRQGWSEDAAERAERRRTVAPKLPTIDWLWQALERSLTWIEKETLDQAWRTQRPG